MYAPSLKKKQHQI